MLYAYFGYPALLFLVAQLRRFQVSAAGSDLPTVTMVVAAWNEEAVIAEKIENTLTQNYPPERLSLIVVSDGSTDGTDSIVKRYAAETPRVRLLHTAGREGKSVALNIGVAGASGDVLVMTDANAIFEPDAVSRLVHPLSDSAVGAVSVHLSYRRGEGTEATEGAYWRYEQVV
ncbi:MAG: glycosyltransferase, partial [Armatimonadetes bacterium]|nr:glycosyltransferase [Armatimonadota bacterium]